MRRGRDLIGAPVIDTGTGRALGTVADLAFRPDGTVSALLVVPATGVVRRAFPVPVERFAAIDAGKVSIDREVLRRHRSARTAGVTLRGEPGGLCGKSLVTSEGKVLGTIADVVLDGPAAMSEVENAGEPDDRPGRRGEKSEESGYSGAVRLSLWGFEVSDGIVKDLLDGRAVVEAAGARYDGSRVVLDQSARHMNLAPGGHATLEGSE